MPIPWSADGAYSVRVPQPEDGLLSACRCAIDFQGNVVFGRRKLYPAETAILALDYLKGEQLGDDMVLAHLIVSAIARRDLPKVEAILDRPGSGIDDAVGQARRYVDSAEARTLNKLIGLPTA